MNSRQKLIVFDIIRKMLDRYIKGDAQVQEARARKKRIKAKSSLSSDDRNTLVDLSGITRRHFMARVRDLALLGGTVAIAGGGFLASENCFQDETAANPEKAAAFRLKIHEYEEQNRDIVNKTTITEIYTMVQDLYSATFGRKNLHNKLVIATPEDLKKRDPNALIPDAPSGIAGVFTVKFDRNTGKIQGFDSIPLLVYTGTETAIDPKVNKLSVIRAILIHEFVHTQTHPHAAPDTGLESVGKELVSAQYSRGLKWVGAQGEPAWFMEETNTQMLTEYTNDPMGQDPIWQQIKESDIYRHSFDASYFLGEAALREIYKKLGITIEQVEKFHYEGQPKEFLEYIDRKIAAKGLILPEPASSTLIKLDTQARDIAKSPNEYTQPLVNLKNAVVNSTP